MLRFYSFSEAARVTFILFTLLSIVVSASALVMRQYRFRRSLDYWLGGAMSLLVLCESFLNAALIAWVHSNLANGYVVPSVYISYRYAVFAAMAAVTVLTLIKIKRKSPMTWFATAAAFLTLPIMETWAGNAFPAFFTAALLYYFAGNVRLMVKIRKELAASISDLSVRQAMDSLGTAALFCRKNGHIIMQNSKMQELMLKTAGRVYFNGKLYIEKIRNEGLAPDSSFIISDSCESVWLFTVREIKAGIRPVIQITAADVTELNRENRLLREKRIELEERHKQLAAFVKDIEEVCRARELLRIKTGIHDTQNERLTALLHYIRSERQPDGESFAAMKAGVLNSLYETEPADPRAMLDAIIGQYGRQGVVIRFDGELPPEHGIALALVQILQEAAANAVMHGYAGEVTAKITQDGKTTAMQVTDNGAPPTKEFREGSGIAGMRRRLAELGGSLDIVTAPCFTVKARIVRRVESEEWS